LNHKFTGNETIKFFTSPPGDLAPGLTGCWLWACRVPACSAGADAQPRRARLVGAPRLAACGLPLAALGGPLAPAACGRAIAPRAAALAPAASGSRAWPAVHPRRLFARRAPPPLRIPPSPDALDGWMWMDWDRVCCAVGLWA